MDTRSRSMFKLCVLLICSILSSQAFGLSARVFVSAQKGTSGCSGTLSSPCRQIVKALTLLQSGGEIIVLDSGGFSNFTIDKSASVIAPDGIYAGVTAGATEDAITVNAGSSDTVVIRGLTLKGTSASANGVRINTDSTVQIENCVIEGFNAPEVVTFASGILDLGAGRIFVKDSVIRDCGIGLELFNSFAVVEHCKLENNFVEGLASLNSSKATIRDSEVSGNFTGVFVTNSSELNMENCLVSGNSNAGVNADTPDASIARVSNSVVTDNGIGLRQANGGSLFSRTNNTVEGNTTDTQGTIQSYVAK